LIAAVFEVVRVPPDYASSWLATPGTD
jgi:hypothetical protein